MANSMVGGGISYPLTPPGVFASSRNLVPPGPWTGVPGRRPGSPSLPMEVDSNASPAPLLPRQTFMVDGSPHPLQPHPFSSSSSSSSTATPKVSAPPVLAPPTVGTVTRPLPSFASLSSTGNFCKKLQQQQQQRMHVNTNASSSCTSSCLANTPSNSTKSKELSRKDVNDALYPNQRVVVDTLAQALCSGKTDMVYNLSYMGAGKSRMLIALAYCISLLFNVPYKIFLIATEPIWLDAFETKGLMVDRHITHASLSRSYSVDDGDSTCLSTRLRSLMDAYEATGKLNCPMLGTDDGPNIFVRIVKKVKDEDDDVEENEDVAVGKGKGKGKSKSKGKSKGKGKDKFEIIRMAPINNHSYWVDVVDVDDEEKEEEEEKYRKPEQDTIKRFGSRDKVDQHDLDNKVDLLFKQLDESGLTRASMVEKDGKQVVKMEDGKSWVFLRRNPCHMEEAGKGLLNPRQYGTFFGKKPSAKVSYLHILVDVYDLFLVTQESKGRYRIEKSFSITCTKSCLTPQAERFFQDNNVLVAVDEVDMFKNHGTSRERHLLEFFKCIRLINPSVRFVMMGGTPMDKVEQATVYFRYAGILTKPLVVNTREKNRPGYDEIVTRMKQLDSNKYYEIIQQEAMVRAKDIYKLVFFMFRDIWLAKFGAGTKMENKITVTKRRLHLKLDKEDEQVHLKGLKNLMSAVLYSRDGSDSNAAALSAFTLGRQLVERSMIPRIIDLAKRRMDEYPNEKVVICLNFIAWQANEIATRLKDYGVVTIAGEVDGVVLGPSTYQPSCQLFNAPTLDYRVCILSQCLANGISLADTDKDGRFPRFFIGTSMGIRYNMSLQALARVVRADTTSDVTAVICDVANYEEMKTLAYLYKEVSGEDMAYNSVPATSSTSASAVNEKPNEKHKEIMGISAQRLFEIYSNKNNVQKTVTDKITKVDEIRMNEYPTFVQRIRMENGREVIVEIPDDSYRYNKSSIRKLENPVAERIKKMAMVAAEKVAGKRQREDEDNDEAKGDEEEKTEDEDNNDASQPPLKRSNISILMSGMTTDEINQCKDK